jgi:hypothetical protein
VQSQNPVHQAPSQAGFFIALILFEIARREQIEP